MEPVRLQVEEGTVTALPIGRGKLLTVSHMTPREGDSVAKVVDGGFQITGLLRVVYRGPPAGESVPLEANLEDAVASSKMTCDWSILWFEPEIEPEGPLRLTEANQGDTVAIRGYAAAAGGFPITVTGKVERLVVGPNGPPVAFLVRPSANVGPLAGLSGSPVYVVRHEDGGPHCLLAGICQGHLETDGPSNGLIRCLPVPEEAKAIIEREAIAGR